MSSVPLVTRQERLKEMQRPCANCDVNMKKREVLRCARCKQAQYCSRSCQKAHWKTVHRIACDPPEDGSTPHRDPAVRLAEHLVSNDELMLVLKKYAAVLLNLYNEPENCTKFAVHVICAARPIEGEVLNGRQKVMFSHKEIVRVPIDDTERRQPSVKKCLSASIADLARVGDASLPVVFYFTNEEGGPAVIVAARGIPLKLIEDARETVRSVRSKAPRALPESWTCEFITLMLSMELRTKIEGDTENKLKLRRYLPKD